MRLLLPVLLFTSLIARADAPPSFPLEQELASLKEDRLFKTAEVAIQVVDLRTGEEVWAHGADVGLNPASTTKILTAATALRHLGPAYTFETSIHAPVKPDAAGVIKGDLVDKGGAEAFFQMRQPWAEESVGRCAVWR